MRAFSISAEDLERLPPLPEGPPPDMVLAAENLPDLVRDYRADPERNLNGIETARALNIQIQAETAPWSTSSRAGSSSPPSPMGCGNQRMWDTTPAAPGARQRRGTSRCVALGRLLVRFSSRQVPSETLQPKTSSTWGSSGTAARSWRPPTPAFGRGCSMPRLLGDFDGDGLDDDGVI